MARPAGPLAWRERIGVLAYNARVILALLASVAAGALAVTLFGGAVDLGGFPSVAGSPVPTELLALGSLGMLLSAPFIVVAMVQRAHDLDLSGWWLLLTLVPLVGFVFGAWIGLKPGGALPNRFGPPRPATGFEKLIGAVGLALAVAVLAGTLWIAWMSATGRYFN